MSKQHLPKPQPGAFKPSPIPTLEELKATIDQMVALTLQSYAQVGLHPLTVKAVARVLAAMTFEPTQTKEQINFSVEKSAATLQEDIKAMLLRASIDATATGTADITLPKAEA